MGVVIRSPSLHQHQAMLHCWIIHPVFFLQLSCLVLPHPATLNTTPTATLILNTTAAPSINDIPTVTSTKNTVPIPSLTTILQVVSTVNMAPTPAPATVSLVPSSTQSFGGKDTCQCYPVPVPAPTVSDLTVHSVTTSPPTVVTTPQGSVRNIIPATVKAPVRSLIVNCTCINAVADLLL